jgi:hypothetical protein
MDESAMLVSKVADPLKGVPNPTPCGKIPRAELTVPLKLTVKGAASAILIETESTAIDSTTRFNGETLLVIVVRDFTCHPPWRPLDQQ